MIIETQLGLQTPLDTRIRRLHVEIMGTKKDFYEELKTGSPKKGVVGEQRETIIEDWTQPKPEEEAPR
jgi:hypothetical protein